MDPIKYHLVAAQNARGITGYSVVAIFRKLDQFLLNDAHQAVFTQANEEVPILTALKGSIEATDLDQTLLPDDRGRHSDEQIVMIKVDVRKI